MLYIHACAVHHRVAGREARCSFSVDLARLPLQCCWMGCTPRVGAEGRRSLPPGTGTKSPHPAWVTRGPCQARASWKGPGFQSLPTGLASPASQAEPRQGNSAPKGANFASTDTAKFTEQRLYFMQKCRESKACTGGKISIRCVAGMSFTWWCDAAFNLLYAP